MTNLRRLDRAFDQSRNRLLAAMSALEWPANTLSRWTLYDVSAVRSWITGRGDVPPAVLDWLEKLAAWLRDNPPPRAGRGSS